MRLVIFTGIMMFLNAAYPEYAQKLSTSIWCLVVLLYAAFHDVVKNNWGNYYMLEKLELIKDIVVLNSPALEFNQVGDFVVGLSRMTLKELESIKTQSECSNLLLSIM